MKKILSILTALVLCLSICLCIPASGDAERLFDNATLLSSEEADELLAKLDEVSKNHGVDIVVVTVNSTGEKSAKEYAGDFYDYNGYNQNGGIIMVVSMGDRKWHILPIAQSIYVYTNAGLEVMADKVTPLLSDGEYFDCFMTFADLCDNYYTKYETDGKGYDNGDLPKDDFNVNSNLLIALAIGFVIGLVTVLVMKSKLKSVKMQNFAGDYVVQDSLHITGQSDTFLYTNVVSTPKPDDNDSDSSSSSSGAGSDGIGGSF